MVLCRGGNIDIGYNDDPHHHPTSNPYYSALHLFSSRNGDLSTKSVERTARATEHSPREQKRKDDGI